MLNAIVMADYTLSNNPDATVIGVDKDGNAYILEEEGRFTTSNSDFQVVNVSQ